MVVQYRMASRKTGLMYLRSSNTEIFFPIVRNKITTERNFKISEQEMYSNNSKHHPVNFYHNGDAGLSFTVTAVFTKSQPNLMKMVDTWYTSMTPFTIVFGKHLNMKLPLVSKKWIMTKISAKQEYDDVTEWEITFKTYNPPKKIKKVKNELVNRTTISYKWSHKCKKSIKKLNYKQQKKRNFKKSDCVKLLNSIMIELGYMSKIKVKVKTGKKDKKGKPKYKKVKAVPNYWVHGKKAKTTTTSKAIKKFKKDWNKYKLKPAFKKNKKGQYSDVIGKTTFKNIANYKKLKQKKKKK